MLSVRLASAIFVVGNAIIAFLAVHEYLATVNYCKGSPEVAAGGGRFSCLEPPNWFAIDLTLGFFLLLEVILLNLLAAAILYGPRQESLRRARGWLCAFVVPLAAFFVLWIVWAYRLYGAKRPPGISGASVLFVICFLGCVGAVAFTPPLAMVASRYRRVRRAALDTAPAS